MSKVNLDLWNLFIFIVSLGLTYQVIIIKDTCVVFFFKKYIHVCSDTLLNISLAGGQSLK